MINTSLAVSNLDKIDRLKKEITDRKPKLLPQFALLLGIPFFLRDSSSEALIFYGKFIDDKETLLVNWVKWVYAFSLIRVNNREMAQSVLLEIFNDKNDDVLKLLTLYSLDSLGCSSDILSYQLKEHRDKFQDEKKWITWIDSLRAKNIFILLLTGLLEEARKWEKNTKKNEIEV